MDNMIQDKIKKNLDNLTELERLYRENKSAFKKEFNLAYPEIQDHPTSRFWNERLNFVTPNIPNDNKHELKFIIAASLIAAVLAKVPDFTPIKADFYYPRNISLIVFPLLIAYFSWKQKLNVRNVIFLLIAVIFSAVFINILPDSKNSNTLFLSYIHLPLFLWCVLGVAFVGNNLSSTDKRLEFLRYNGDLLIMITIILQAGGLLTGITIGLFNLINIQIQDFYFRYIVIGGFAASPIISTYLVQSNPKLVNKVSPVIAKVFTPLVLITLVIYLFAVITAGKNPYNDREFLLLFNLLLIGVMAIIFFSVTEYSKSMKNQFWSLLLFALSAVTIIINTIALSAIVIRIFEGGITPNRLSVLGGNLLILINLLNVSFRLFKTIKNKQEIQLVENSIANFLPFYFIWAMIVAFIFPLLFGFK